MHVQNRRDRLVTTDRAVNQLYIMLFDNNGQHDRLLKIDISIVHIVRNRSQMRFPKCFLQPAELLSCRRETCLVVSKIFLRYGCSGEQPNVVLVSSRKLIAQRALRHATSLTIFMTLRYKFSPLSVNSIKFTIAPAQRSFLSLAAEITRLSA